jgi:cyclic pyranopterin monophosphate synthase
LQIESVRLLFKEGGKSGLWVHPMGMSDEEQARYQPSDAVL